MAFTTAEKVVRRSSVFLAPPPVAPNQILYFFLLDIPSCPGTQRESHTRIAWFEEDDMYMPRSSNGASAINVESYTAEPREFSKPHFGHSAWSIFQKLSSLSRAFNNPCSSQHKPTRTLGFLGLLLVPHFLPPLSFLRPACPRFRICTPSVYHMRVALTPPHLFQSVRSS